MKRKPVEILEVDRIAAAEFIKDMLDAKFGDYLFDKPAPVS